jgi:hypothetical protein
MPEEHPDSIPQLGTDPLTQRTLEVKDNRFVEIVNDGHCIQVDVLKLSSLLTPVKKR